jgi:hypothetical protein
LYSSRMGLDWVSSGVEEAWRVVVERRVVRDWTRVVRGDGLW